MKSKRNYYGNVKNPASLFYKDQEKNVMSVRQSLFSSLEKKSPMLGVAAKGILQRKLNQANQKNLPMMFELFPWLIRDLTCLSWKKTHEISINWLAIYLYVSFIDEHLDLKTEIKPEEFLGASILAQKGLINLFKIVNGTKFEKLFKDSLLDSANFQLVDVLEQAKVTEEKFEKAKSASGKNKILIACAGALAATKESDSRFIIDFTKKILLAVQYLDDLADFEDDLKQKNITVLLNEVAKKRNLDLKQIKKIELVYELIISGSLLNVISKIEKSLLTSIVLIDSNANKKKGYNPSYRFFTSLYLEVLMLRTLLENNQNNFKELPSKSKKRIIEKVERAITKIYLHT